IRSRPIPSTLPNFSTWCSRIATTDSVTWRRRFWSTRSSSSVSSRGPGANPPRLDPPGEVDLLGGREERDLPDLLQVHPNGIVRGCLQEIDVELALGRRVDLVAGDLDDLDPLAAQVLLDLGEELLHLFGREVVDGNRFEQVVGGHEPALTPAGGDLLFRFFQTQVAGGFGQCSRSRTFKVGNVEKCTKRERPCP